MAAAAGKGGKMMIASDVVASVKSWSLSAKSDMYNSESLGDSWKEVTPGLKEWAANVELDWDMSDTAQAAIQTAYLNGTSVAVKLYTNGSNYYSGTAYISDLSVDDPVGDLVKAKATLQGSGTLSYA